MPKTHKNKKENKPGGERQRRIYDFLSQIRAGVLTMTDTEGCPYGVVVYYAVGSDCVIYFLTRIDTKKYKSLKKDARVMLVVFQPASQTVAQVTGKAEEVADSTTVNEIAADVFRTSLDQSEGSFPLSKLDAGEYTAFVISPHQIRMARYGEPGSGDINDIFESIESFNLKESWC